MTDDYHNYIHSVPNKDNLKKMKLARDQLKSAIAELKQDPAATIKKLRPELIGKANKKRMADYKAHVLANHLFMNNMYYRTDNNAANTQKGFEYLVSVLETTTTKSLLKRFVDLELFNHIVMRYIPFNSLQYLDNIDIDLDNTDFGKHANLLKNYMLAHNKLRF